MAKLTINDIGPRVAEIERAITIGAPAEEIERLRRELESDVIGAVSSERMDELREMVNKLPEDRRALLIRQLEAGTLDTKGGE